MRETGNTPARDGPSLPPLLSHDARDAVRDVFVAETIAAEASTSGAEAITIRLLRPLTITIVEALRAEEARGTPLDHAVAALPVALAFAFVNGAVALFEREEQGDAAETLLGAFADAVRSFATEGPREGAPCPNPSN